MKVISFAEAQNDYLRLLVAGELGAGIPLGFPELDEAVYGLRQTVLAMATARTSIGKSAFVQNVCVNVARNDEVEGDVLYVPTERLFSAQVRFQAISGGLEVGKLLKGEYSMAEVAKATEGMRDCGLCIAVARDVTVSGIREVIESHPNPLALVVVDYLGQMTAEGEFKEGHERLTSIMRGLQRLAHDGKLPPLLVAAQQNREAAKNGRPSLHTMRGSGSIEQDADLVFGLWERLDPKTGEPEGRDYNAGTRSPIITSLKDTDGASAGRDFLLHYDVKTQRMTERLGLHLVQEPEDRELAEALACD